MRRVAIPLPRPRLLPLLALVTSLAAAACDDPAGSERGVYVLRTVGDSTVPFVSVNGGTYRFIQLGDTITLDGRGDAREATATRMEYDGSAPSVSAYATTRRYTMRGDTVEFVFVCPPGAACIQQLAGYVLVTGGMATFSLDPRYPVPTSFFERIQ